MPHLANNTILSKINVCCFLINGHIQKITEFHPRNSRGDIDCQYIQIVIFAWRGLQPCTQGKALTERVVTGANIQNLEAFTSPFAWISLARVACALIFRRVIGSADAVSIWGCRKSFEFSTSLAMHSWRPLVRYCLIVLRHLKRIQQCLPVFNYHSTRLVWPLLLQ